MYMYSFSLLFNYIHLKRIDCFPCVYFQLFKTFFSLADFHNYIQFFFYLIDENQVFKFKIIFNLILIVDISF